MDLTLSSKDEVDQRAFCKWCNKTLPLNHEGPCPQCGKKGKHFAVTITASVKIKDSLKTEFKYLKENQKMLFVVFLITYITAFLGYFISGVWGIVIGLLLGFISFLLGSLASKEVIERDHYH